MKRPLNISLVFPVYFDENTVEKVTLKSIRVLSSLCNEFEIIIVDDASPDNSGKIADELEGKYPNLIRVIHHSSNKGYGAALKAGCQISKHEWICQIDGDDQYNIEELYKCLDMINKYDLIITCRKNRPYSNTRIIISIVYNYLIRLIFKTPFRDISTGFRLIHRKVLSDIELKSDSPFIGAELSIKSFYKNYNINEFVIDCYPREFGKGSSVSFYNIIVTIRDLLRLKWIMIKRG